MVSGGVNQCIRYALFAFNFAFVVVGIVLIALGVSTLNGFRYLQLVETHSFAAPPKLFIAIGVIMFLIAFLGCCGAYMENHVMIMAYSVLIGLLLVLQLGVGIAAFLLEDDVENLAQIGLNRTLVQYHDEKAPDVEDIRRSWDIVQSELQCCGVRNLTDWKGTEVKPGKFGNDSLVPYSCCIGGIVEGCSKNITKANIDDPIWSTVVYTDGCLHKAVEQLAIARIGSVGVGLAVIELLGIVCACFLARSIRFSYETV